MKGGLTHPPQGAQAGLDRKAAGDFGIRNLEELDWFDMHMHAGFARDRQALAGQARRSGLFLNSASVNLGDFLESQAAFGTCPQIQVGLGLHPWWIASDVAPSRLVKPGVPAGTSFRQPAGSIAGGIGAMEDESRDGAAESAVQARWHAAGSHRDLAADASRMLAAVGPEEMDRRLEEVLRDLEAQHPQARSYAPAFREALILSCLEESWPLIGEIGVDTWPKTLAQAPLWVQRQVFSIICKAAATGAHLLSIHASGKGAATACLDVLEETGCTRNPEATIIFHWFSGTSWELQRARRLGCWFSIGIHGLEMKKWRSYAREIGSGRLLLETDLPADPGDELTACQVIGQLEQAEASLSRILDKDMASILRENSVQVLMGLAHRMG